jgi:hypothetical protein
VNQCERCHRYLYGEAEAQAAADVADMKMVQAENGLLHLRMAYWRERVGIYDEAISKILGGEDKMVAISKMRGELAAQDAEYTKLAEGEEG